MERKSWFDDTDEISRGVAGQTMQTKLKGVAGWLFAALACLVGAASPVHAADSGSGTSTSYTDFLTVPNSDLTFGLAGVIVGPAWAQVNSRTTDTTSQLAGTRNDSVPGGLLGVISASLTTACMVVVTILVLWSNSAFPVLTAAHMGINAGQRYNTLWGPFRVVMSLAFLAPVLAGYCLLQVGVMKVAYWSIGMADATYSNVINYVAAGNPISYQMPEGTSNLASGVLASLVCESYFNAQQANLINRQADLGTATGSGPAPTGTLSKLASYIPFLPTHEQTILQGVKWTTAPGYSMPKGAACGEFLYRSTIKGDPSEAAYPISVAAINTRAAAITNLVQALKPIADKIVAHSAPGDAAVSGPQGGTSSEATFRTPLENEFLKAIIDFNTSMATATSGAQLTADGKLLGLTSQEISATMRDGGWAMLGGFYWNLHSLNSQVNKANLEMPAIDPPMSPDDLKMRGVPYTEGYEIITQYTNAFLTSAQPGIRNVATVIAGPGGTIATGLGARGDGRVDNTWLERVAMPTLVGEDTSIGYWMVEKFMRDITGDGDVVANLQNFGQWMFFAGTSTVAAMAGEKALSGNKTMGKASSIIKGATGIGGMAMRGVGWIVNVAYATAKFAVLPMLLIGVFLGFYLPFIPLFYWFLNVLNWFLMFGKALMAAPVWAAAHAIPDGEGWAGQSARHGYFLIFALVLTPLLLLTGQLLAMLVLEVAAIIPNTLFPLMMRSAFSDDYMGLGSGLVLIAIYTFGIITMAQKCFALSHDLRDEILRWIGAGAENFGGEANSEAVYRTTVAGGMVNTATSGSGSLNNAFGARK